MNGHPIGKLLFLFFIFNIEVYLQNKASAKYFKLLQKMPKKILISKSKNHRCTNLNMEN